MSRAGQLIENPVIGTRCIVRVGTEDSGGESLLVEMFVQPGGSVAGEHVHPIHEERFTLLRGQLGLRLDGEEALAPVGQTIVVPPGVRHAWWNAGNEEARVLVQVLPGTGFEDIIVNLFSLAQDGKVNAKGMPNLLQMALFAREFAHVTRYTSPPAALQKVLFGLLAPIARLRGYRGSYPEYLNRAWPIVPVEPLPEEILPQLS